MEDSQKADLYQEDTNLKTESTMCQSNEEQTNCEENNSDFQEKTNDIQDSCGKKREGSAFFLQQVKRVKCENFEVTDDTEFVQQTLSIPTEEILKEKGTAQNAGPRIESLVKNEEKNSDISKTENEKFENYNSEEHQQEKNRPNSGEDFFCKNEEPTQETQDAASTLSSPTEEILKEKETVDAQNEPIEHLVEKEENSDISKTENQKFENYNSEENQQEKSRPNSDEECFFLNDEPTQEAEGVACNNNEMKRNEDSSKNNESGFVLDHCENTSITELAAENSARNEDIKNQVITSVEICESRAAFFELNSQESNTPNNEENDEDCIESDESDQEDEEICWFESEIIDYERSENRSQQENHNKEHEENCIENEIVNYERSKINNVFIREALKDQLATHWQSTEHRPYVLNPVEKDTDEYREVLSLFSKTCGSLKIKKLERVENPYLLALYLTKKEEMRQINLSLEEKSLFHGTAEANVESICKNNFDWRRHGQARGHAFGKGVYFAPEAWYAHRYSPSNLMFLTKVLVSKKTVGSSSTVKPVEEYDTTTNSKETVFVKYEDDEFFPQYLIRCELAENKR